MLALAFDRLSGKHLASGSEDQSIIIWNLEKQKKKFAPLKGHSGPITSLAFTFLGGELVSGSLDETIRLWKVSTGEMLSMFFASGMGSVYSVVCYDYRHILSGS